MTEQTLVWNFSLYNLYCMQLQLLGPPEKAIGLVINRPGVAGDVLQTLLLLIR